MITIKKVPETLEFPRLDPTRDYQPQKPQNALPKESEM